MGNMNSRRRVPGVIHTNISFDPPVHNEEQHERERLRRRQLRLEGIPPCVPDNSVSSFSPLSSQPEMSKELLVNLSVASRYKDTHVFRNLRLTLASIHEQNFSKYQLHYLILNNNLSALRDIIKITPNINLNFSSVVFEYIELTPLHIAVKYDYLDIAKLLLRTNSACVQGRDIFGNTPLHYAIDYENEEMAKLLLRYGANINCKNNEYFTPLHLASYKDNTSMVKFLIENGANVNCRNFQLVTPLHFAACHGSIDSMKLLIQHKADVFCSQIYYDTPMTYAAWGNVFNIPGVTNTLHKYIPIENKIKAISVLINAGVDIQETRNINGDNVLHILSRDDDNGTNCPVAQFVIDKGVNVNACNFSLETPLHVAVFKPCMHMIMSLVRNGGNMNARDEHNNTPLHNAAFCGSIDAVQLLINYGADVFAIDKFYAYPYDYAMFMKFRPIARILDRAMAI